MCPVPDWTGARESDFMKNIAERESGLQALREAMASPVVFVPTMGALHEGHAALISQARQISPSVIVSIFINPLQFENSSDFDAYPVTHELDRRLAQSAGAKFIWIPRYEEIYPGEIERISSGVFGKIFEGRSRDGHFDGVLTVVKRLFESVRPDKAIFGEKDFQQLFLIKKMVDELHLGVEVITHPTVRDDDGLALSSRNTRLSADGRRAASVIYRAMMAASVSRRPRQVLHQVLMSEPRFKIDYAEVIDERDLSIVDDESENFNKRLIVAGWIEDVRLIDNMKISAGSS